MAKINRHKSIAQLLEIGIKDFYDERIAEQYEVWQQ